MSARRIAIVGAGPAGLATAQSYREHGGDGEVTLIGKERLLPYRRPPLTKEFLRGEIEADELTIQSREWFDEHQIELRLGHQVTAIDAHSATLNVDGGQLHCDAVVLATGGEPARPNLPGLTDPRVQTVRERGDSERLATDVQPGSRVIVIGSGFIGCELAATLALRGAQVTLVGQEAAPQRQRLGAQAAAYILRWLDELEVRARMSVRVRSVEDGRIVELEGGERIEADSVVLGMGVQPRTRLAEQAGLRTAKQAILTDARMHARERVFAVGDVAYAHNRTAGRRLRVEHWGDALGQGKVAGRVLAGEDAEWQEVPGFWSTIGRRTLKYAAWGDGYESARTEDHPGGAFTVWYVRDRKLVGVLTHDRDEDHERGRRLIAMGESVP